MRRHVLSNLDDLDLDAHELVKAAAHRAGLSLEDWAALVLSGRDGGRSSSLGTPRRQTGDGIDSVIARMSRTARRQPGRDYETLMAAAAESERQSKDQASRTAIALESMAAWIEQAEERLSETAIASADQQDRIAATLSQALSSMKERLETVERRVAAPPRIEFPVQEAVQALAPLSDTLVGLRSDVSRLAVRLEQTDTGWAPAVDGIQAEIERLRTDLGGLASRDEIASLEHSLREIAKDIAQDLEQGRPSKDLLTLASSVAALYRQVRTLSDEVTDGVHRRIGGEIEQIRQKIDTISEAGVDRSVIDFLSSQIVDLRQDLAHRAEPKQIERLSGDIASLSRQVADLRINQVGRSDFAVLKTSLENVCAALNRSVAAQEASDVPERLQSLSQRLDILVDRPEPQPADLDPIAEQLALLTERMASLSDNRLAQADTLTEMIGRLSSQVQAVADRDSPSQQPLLERFDRIEEELRQVGQQADTSSVERMLRTIDGKLDDTTSQFQAFDALEQKIMALADRFSQMPGEPLQKALDEATAHLRNLQSEAEGIAERAARAALKDIRPSLPDPGDLDTLKQGFVELRALQTRTDKKTQQTLRSVHEALETLMSRLPGQAKPPQPSDSASQAPADRLEAAVRKLHAAALAQMEEVSGPVQEAPSFVPAQDPTPVMEPTASETSPGAAMPPLPSGDLGNVRASFIAAARRAALASAPDAAPLRAERDEPEKSEVAEFSPLAESAPPSPPSLIERIRRSLDSHLRPLLFSLAFLVLAAGAAELLSTQESAAAHASMPPRTAQVRQADPVQPPMAAAPIQPSANEPRPVQTSVMRTELPPPILLAAGKYLVDPQTVGTIPGQAPEHLRQAALSGDAVALYEIAMQAAEGRGLAKDMSLALHLYERAAQAGLPPAQERLALMYEKGFGVPRDLKQAVVWHERAAQGGNVRAMHNLATLLASGIQGKPDYAAALRWYSEAAEAGLRDSQFNMGVLLARGVATKVDLPNAFKWYALAARQGDADAARKRDEIAARMSEADLSAARALVDRWRPRAADPVANELPPSSEGRAAFLDRTISIGS